MIWLLAHIYPVLQIEPMTTWEIGEAHKLLDYGFLNRAGAIMPPGLMFGRVAHPEDFNFTHHPHPIVWLFTGVLAVAGPWPCIFLVLALRLAATVAVWRLLQRYFQPWPAWFASVLYAVAPIGLALAPDTNCIALGAVIWPFAAALALDESGRRSRLWLLGLVIFLGGQSAWLSLTLGPVLLWLAWPAERLDRAGLRAAWQSPRIRMILFSSIATLVFFIAQIVWYAPNFHELVEYVIVRMGLKQPEISRNRMLVLVVARWVVFAGPALWLGVLLGLKRIGREPAQKRLLLASAFYLVIFAGTALVLTHFYFIERSPFTYTLFPSAVLAAAALEGARRLWLPVVLSVMSVATAFYMYLGASIPLYSNTARAFAEALREHTKVGDAIATNIGVLQPPFAYWDTGGPHASALLADRLVYYPVATSAEFELIPAELKRNYLSAVFALVEENEIAPDLRHRIETEGQRIAVVDLVVTPEPESLGQRVREKVWQLSGRYQQRTRKTASAHPTRITFYRLK